MKISLKKGLSYGVTSGVITTLGLIIGLYFSESGRDIILAGILTIAFADALSDGLGIHISEEAENKHSKKEIWESTLSTVVTKMIFALSFIIPILLFSMGIAIIINLIWGAALLIALSYYVARNNKENVLSVLAEHVGIAIIVIAGSFAIGGLINLFFN